MKKIICQLIHIYQATRGLRPAACRFTPSCSDYAYEAIEKYGVWKGLSLALQRLSKCHPLHQSHGYDPVP